MLDAFFLLLALIISLPAAQLLIDVLLYDIRWLRDLFRVYNMTFIEDWLIEEEQESTLVVGLLVLATQWSCYVASPDLQFYVTGSITLCVLWKAHKLWAQAKRIELAILKDGVFCPKHPGLKKFIGIDKDGNVQAICKKCDPKLAEYFGHDEGDDDNPT